MARILIAEDDDDLRELITFKIEQAGHTTTPVGTGPEVLDQVAADRPDLLLLDVTLPGMDGLRVCATLRERHPTPHLPIILLTGMTKQSDIDAGLTSGADDYVCKPFKPADLLDRIHALLPSHEG
ncbi:response regulator transcription factor [Actinokineospora auranticolor]|uniref:Response regulator receiver domain-containing protein n=1 Tax=Actinokineospora auranticolor TaxID=155976 RepID=A0A2S6GCU8_9PSEU|nr:response regulator transcription factor [Actinokineospora auranticolor]PPK63069.1 response regulator receiver domain-containing protein [Actinokineospora auranticolor]